MSACAGLGSWGSYTQIIDCFLDCAFDQIHPDGGWSVLADAMNSSDGLKLECGVDL